jgi:hypothetical protein
LELDTYVYGFFIIFWASIFLELWDVESSILKKLWSVEGIVETEPYSCDFKPEKFLKDIITEKETVPYYPDSKRLWKILLVRLPVVFLAVLFVISVVVLLFIWETILAEYYHGPFKSVLAFTPTIGYVASIPYLTQSYDKIAKSLTKYENYATSSQIENNFITKMFFINFVLIYVPFFMILFVLVPFSNHLDDFQRIIFGGFFETKSTGGDITFSIAKDLKRLLISHMSMGQIVGFVQELLVPFFTRKIVGAISKKEKIEEKKEIVK